jgi:hypothetical protein
MYTQMKQNKTTTHDSSLFKNVETQNIVIKYYSKYMITPYDKTL